MRLYLKNCEPQQFRTITHLLLGAEKLKPELARDIQQALGIEPLEGYGCTELSPVVAVNVPNEVVMPDGRSLSGNRLGTVGQPFPGTAIKTIDPETGADLPPGTEGIIAVKGPQVMVGYLNRPEATDAGHEGRLVLDRRPRLSSTPTASSRSPTASAGSPRSPARWCRTWESSRRSWR